MILLVNDDGLAAAGLRALHAALREAGIGPVLAVAPQHERSGQSHAITLDRPLRVDARHDGDRFGFTIDGTPTDCVKVALDALCPRPPALVISGINDGPNVGRSLFYSGTVAAAMEAAVMGLSALAVSRARGDRPFADAAAATLPWVRRLLRTPHSGRVLNLNLPALPAAEWREWRVAAHGHAGFRETYRPARDTQGRPGWLIHGEWHAAADDDDAALLGRGHPVATLLRPDLNADQADLDGWLPP